MYAAYVSKHDLNPEKSYSFKDSKWRKLALSCTKKLSILLRGITSKNVGEYYVWIVFIILEQEKNLVIIKEYVKTLYIFIFFIFTFL